MYPKLSIKDIAESAKFIRTDTNHRRNGSRSDRVLHGHVRPLPFLGDLPPPAIIGVEKGAGALLGGCKTCKTSHINPVE